jgi:hypothetical protein
MIAVFSVIMAKFLASKNIKFRQEKAKTSNSNYFYFPIGGRHFVLRISDHDRNDLGYDFSIKAEKDIGHVQKQITKYIELLR